MSDVPTSNPTPTSATPTTVTAPTPEPVVAPVVEPVVEEAPKSLVTEPEVPSFDPETLTLPEGLEKGEGFTQFTEWAKEAGINQPQAEKLLSLHAEAMKQIVQAPNKVFDEQNLAWVDEVKTDKELANLPLVKQTIAKVLDNPDLSDPKFREALNFTGAGNNPAVIRTLYRWAQKLTEGASVVGTPPARDGNGALANRSENLAQTFYGPQGPHTGGPRIG